MQDQTDKVKQQTDQVIQQTGTANLPHLTRVRRYFHGLQGGPADRTRRQADGTLTTTPHFRLELRR